MYQYKTLSNGIKVVAEKIDYLKSISIGVWVGNGSRYENKEVNGFLILSSICFLRERKIGRRHKLHTK